MKSKLFIFAILAISVLLFLTKKEKENEIISPMVEVTEEPTPTPTDTPKHREADTSVKVSFYNEAYCEKYNPACITASGERFDDTAFTCACSYAFEIGDKIVVSYQGKSVEVVCNDRGSFSEKYGRVLDLSEASFEALAPLSKGVLQVNIEVLKG